MNTPLGRFGVDTTHEGADRCVASIPVAGLTNPSTGEATVANFANKMKGAVRFFRCTAW